MPSSGGAALGVLTFRPHLEERVWGGRHLERHGRALPDGVPIGESWEISAIRGRSSVVDRGPHEGETFDDLVRRHRQAIVGGARPSGAAFPLLLKLLDSREALSVQVHPDDREAVEIHGPGEESVGKTEAWIILDAEPGAEIVHGLAPGVDPADLWSRLEALGGDRLPPGEERALFRWVPVARGDVVFVPAGTVHALGPGVVLAEVQQSSDLTYRLYDWGRRGAEGKTRDLHLAEARRVRLAASLRCPWTSVDTAASLRKTVVPLVECDRFRLELVSLGSGERLEGSTAGGGSRRFHVLFGWSGSVRCSPAGGDPVGVEPESFVLLAADTGAYDLRAASPGISRCVRILAV